jgi:hypothetical protein
MAYSTHISFTYNSLLIGKKIPFIKRSCPFLPPPLTFENIEGIGFLYQQNNFGLTNNHEAKRMYSNYYKRRIIFGIILLLIGIAVIIGTSMWISSGSAPIDDAGRLSIILLLFGGACSILVGGLFLIEGIRKRPFEVGEPSP